MNIAWFTPVAGDGAIAEYSREVSAAMAGLCDVCVYGDQQSERFPAEVRSENVAIHPQALSALGSFDTVFYNLGNDVTQYAWIFDVARARPGIVVLHDVALHGFFIEYYVRHLRRPDLYITRMAEDYGLIGLRTAYGVLGPRFNLVGGALEPEHLLRYTFLEEALRSATGAIVHSDEHREIVRQAWGGPVCKLDAPEQPAHRESMLDYAKNVLRFVADDTSPTGGSLPEEALMLSEAERIATHVGESLASLDAKQYSPGVETVISEAIGLLSPR